VIRRYLPTLLSEDETRAIVRAKIAALGVSSKKEPGPGHEGRDGRAQGPGRRQDRAEAGGRAPELTRATPRARERGVEITALAASELSLDRG
jgi:hypothetical protein